MIPELFFLTKGVGKQRDQLQSFELALRDAGIQYCNLVNVSSIVPAGCKLISREQGLKMLQPGEITYVVQARNSTKEPHRLLASSIGVAIPSGKNQYGYLSEHTTLLGRLMRQREITRKTWLQRCWRQPWAFSSTLKQRGMSENGFSKLAE
jgi:pyruvoyl-dependent arginine decarboxylase